MSLKTDDYKCLFQRKTVPLKILDHCKWPPEIMTVPLKCMAASLLWNSNTPLIEISVKYIVYTQFMAASAVLKQIQYPLRSGWQELILWNKETLYPGKNC